MVLETWVAPLIVVGFNLDLDNALDLSTLSAFAATLPDISGVDLVGNIVMRHISSCFLPISTATPCFGNTFAFVYNQCFHILVPIWNIAMPPKAGNDLGTRP